MGLNLKPLRVRHLWQLRGYMLNRRALLALSSSVFFAAGLAMPAHAQDANAAKLLEPGRLPEKVFGSSDAPVTVIEYASMTCHHCMNFHKNV